MLLQINPHSPVPIYRQIMDQVRYQILAGVIKESQQLLSVRDLSAKIKVNPMTVSKAYAYLEMEGLLDRKRGIGLFAAKLKTDQKNTSSRKLIKTKLQQVANEALSLGLDKEQFVKIAEKTFNSLKRQK
jgi:GntR family transcriptional regulator